MPSKRVWTLQSFVLCFVCNTALVLLIFFLARQALSELYRWIDPVITAGAAELPRDLHLSLISLEQLISRIGRFLAPVLFGLGGGATLILWLLLQFMGRRLLNRGFTEGDATVGLPAEVAEREVVASGAEPHDDQPSPQGAVQILSILQRQGRLIDFLHEDLALYDDSQIGAAVRNIHQGCRDALREYVKVEQIFEEEEGVEVSVPTGFDSRAIRLTGKLTGNEPPFRGTLRHRGWRVTHIELPQSTMKQIEDWILAPAEVEVA